MTVHRKFALGTRYSIVGSEFIREHLLRFLIPTNEIWQRENETVNKEIASSVLDPWRITPGVLRGSSKKISNLVQFVYDWQSVLKIPLLPSFPGYIFNFPFVIIRAGNYLTSPYALWMYRCSVSWHNLAVSIIVSSLAFCHWEYLLYFDSLLTTK